MNELEREVNIAQDYAVKSFLKKKKASVPFPCGLGKTIIALKAVNELKLLTVIFVESKHMEKWKEEIEKWVAFDAKDLILLRTHSMLSSKSSFEYNKLKKLKPAFVVTDETHNFKDLKSSRASKWSKLSNWKCVKYHMLLSATPITNSEESLYTTFKACGLVGKDKRLRNKEEFEREFFNMTRIKIEKRVIYKPTSLKRYKTEEFYSLVKSVSTEARVLKVLSMFPKLVNIYRFKGNLGEDLTTMKLGERVKFLAESSAPRLDEHKETIDKMIKGRRAVIYYAHKALGERLKDTYKVDLLSGGETIPNRNKTIKEFNDHKTNLLIGSIPACSSGYDFFDVDVIILLESTYSYATNLQAILRGRRFSRKLKQKPIPVVYLLYKEEETYRKAQEKKIRHIMVQDVLYT